jgi:hypothetical protein
MKIKSSELIGAPLDWAVSRIAQPHLSQAIKPGVVMLAHGGPYAPSLLWEQGGPIIERENIKVAPNINGTWSAQIRHAKEHPLVAQPVLTGWTNKHGPTPLVAAMRCFVASKLGDEVDVPEELLK